MQIPPPRSGTGPRWEADAPLDIVFHCVSQCQWQRQQLGLELMTLVNILLCIQVIRVLSFAAHPYLSNGRVRLPDVSGASRIKIIFSLPRNHSDFYVWPAYLTFSATVQTVSLPQIPLRRIRWEKHVDPSAKATSSSCESSAIRHCPCQREPIILHCRRLVNCEQNFFTADRRRRPPSYGVQWMQPYDSNREEGTLDFV